jgi:hypothetical protein
MIVQVAAGHNLKGVGKKEPFCKYITLNEVMLGMFLCKCPELMNFIYLLCNFLQFICRCCPSESQDKSCCKSSSIGRVIKKGAQADCRSIKITYVST